MAALVMLKTLEEWFEPKDPQHALAAYQLWKTGRWPTGFIPSNVHVQQEVDPKAQGKKLWDRCDRFVSGESLEYIVEYRRVLDVVGKLSFPGYEFVVEPFSGWFTLHVRYVEPDVMSGVPEEQNGRRWLFPADQTVGQIAQTAFKAVLTSLEHRAREHFTYRGRPVLQPHMDIEQVWQLLSDQNTHATEVSFANENGRRG